MKGKYSDMLHLPRPVSKKHRQMPREMRAAQFAPFAALSGFEDAVNETARLTDKEAEKTEEMIGLLDAALRLLKSKETQKPEIRVVYFVADDIKPGGTYVCYTGRLRRIDETGRMLVFTDGKTLETDSIYQIDYEEEGG